MAENVTFGIGYAPRCPASAPDTSTNLVVLRSGQHQLPDGCTAARPQAQAEDAIAAADRCVRRLHRWGMADGVRCAMVAGNLLVTAIALATQVPLAVTLEVGLHAETAGLGPSIYSVGLPEELAKAIPVLVVALVYRLFVRRELAPRDYLFLGAVSGLVFGASEVVHYFTVNGVEQFYLTVQSALPAGGAVGPLPSPRTNDRSAARPSGCLLSLRT